MSYTLEHILFFNGPVIHEGCWILQGVTGIQTHAYQEVSES